MFIFIHKHNTKRMSKKKILVKEAGLVDFFKSFFKAKSNGNESEWLGKLRKANPELADIWKDYDNSLSKSMWNQKRNMEKLGMDTTSIDTMIKKYGLKDL